MVGPKLSSAINLFSMPEKERAVTPLIESLSSFGSPSPSIGPTITNQKKAQVAATTEAKKIALADESTLRTLAAAQINSNRLATESQLLQDLRTMTSGEVFDKYGEEVLLNRHRILDSESEFVGDISGERNSGEILKDTAVDFTNGLFDMTGSIAALGAGLVSDDAGVAVSQFVEQGSKDFDLSRSERYRRHNEANELMSALDQAENRQDYEAALVDPDASPTWETMKYWGKSAGDATSRVASDPALLTGFVARNAGSLIPSVGLAKGAQAITAGTKLAPFAVPVAVALGESGAAYTGAVNRVMEMSPEELATSSPDYRGMIAKGMSHEDAVTEIATDAGMLAAAVQAPLAAAAGKVVEKFEVSPMASGSFKDAMADVAKQVLEEGFQEGTGQFNQNLGIQTFADENQELMEGVPEGTALGALGGLGTTAAIKAPGLAKDAAVDAVKGTLKGIGNVVDARVAKAKAKIDAVAPSGQSATVKAAEAAQTKASTALQTLESDTTVDPTSAPVVDYKARLKQSLNMEQADVDAMPQSLRDMVWPDGNSTLPEGAAVPRLNITTGMLQMLEDKNTDPQTKNDISLWLNEQANLFEAAKDADVSKLPAATQEEHRQMLEQLDIIRSNPRLNQAVEEAPKLEMKDLGSLPEITDANVSTPEVQTAVSRVVQLAQTNPSALDPAYGRVILNQATAGRISLEERVQQRLKLAITIAEAIQAHQKVTEELAAGAKNSETEALNVGIVRNMVLRDGKRNDLNQFSLLAHLGKIMSLARADNKSQLKLALESLRNFAEHYQGKKAAANESLTRRPGQANKVKYRTWTGANWLEADSKDAGDVFVNPRSENSLIVGKAVVEDADMVFDLYNTLAEELGSNMGLEPVVYVQADSRIAGKAQDTKPKKAEPKAEVADDSIEFDVPPVEDGEPEEQAPTKERRISRRALLKPKNSLIDSTESDAVERLGVDTEEGKIEKEKKRVRVLAPSKRPFTRFLIDRITGIDPNGTLGKELKAAGLSANNTIGLFKTGGIDRLDNIPADEFGEYGQILEQDGNGYLPEQAIYDALVSEFNGTPIQDSEQMAREAIAEAKEADRGRKRGSVPEASTQEAEATSEEETGETGSTGDGDGSTGEATDPEEEGQGGAEDTGTDFVADVGANASGRMIPESRFSNLARSLKGISRFIRAYTLDWGKSPLAATDNPIEVVLDQIDNFEEYQQDLGVDYDLTVEQKEAFGSLIQNEVRDLVEALNEQLKKPVQTLKGDKNELISPLQGLRDGKKNVTGFKELRSLNLVDPVTGKFDPMLIELAALAALNWTLTSNPLNNPDEEQVARTFGVPQSEVTPGMMSAARNSVGAATAVESLAREIMTFWGAKAKGNAPQSDTLGIVQGLASDLLDVMRGRMTEETSVATGREKDGVPLEAIAIKVTHPKTKERVGQLTYARGFLKQAFIKGVVKPYHFDKAPETVRKKQKRNALGWLGEKATRAMKRHQEQKFTRNTPIITLWQGMGQDAWMDLRGYDRTPEKFLNKAHKDSVDGSNTHLQKSWEGVMNHNLHLESHARVEGKNPDEVVTHFDVDQISNERIHQVGFNPQSNKAMREAQVSTVSELDLDNAEQNHFFWLTVGQSSGVIKTEKVFEKPGEADPDYKHARTAKLVRQKVEATYGKVIETLMPLARNGQMTAEETAAYVAEMKKHGPITDKLEHSLVAVAQYRVAMEKPVGERILVHRLSLEADGKTDGPMAALVNNLTGLLTLDKLKNFRRGGFFPGQRDKTLNDQYGLADPELRMDLYEVTSSMLQGIMPKSLKAISDAGFQPQVGAMLRILKHFNKDFSFREVKPGEYAVTIGRGLLKNPLTVTVYASGNDGIAQKIAGEVLEAVYAKMTELEVYRDAQGNINLDIKDLPGMDGYETLFEDLKILSTSRLVRDFDGNLYLDPNTKTGLPALLRAPKSAQEFELSPRNREMFATNVKTILVESMAAAIDSVMADPKAVNMKMVQATQVQANTMIAHFRQTVREVLLDKRSKGELEPGEYLSQDDYNDIFKKLARFGAIIEPVDSRENHINLSGAETVKSSEEFTRSMTGRYGESTRLMEPGGAGVAAAAMMTISRGDAAMMINYFASQDPDLRVLAVFDGLEMPADGINTISEMINKAVGEAWFGSNGFKDLAESFADFSRQGKEGPFGGLKDHRTVGPIAEALGLKKVYGKLVSEGIKQAGKAPTGKAATKAAVDAYEARLSSYILPKLLPEMTRALGSLQTELNQISYETQAWKAVFNSIDYSMDHMASGRSPFVNEGETFDADPSDPEFDQKLVGWLNFRYEEELAKITGARKDQLAQSSIEPESDALKAKIKEHGVEMGYRPITRMTTRALVRMLQSAKVSKDAGEIFKVIQKALPDFTFLFGSPEELSAYRNETYPQMQDLGPIDKGQTDMQNRVVYIANQSGETVLHEALHTATMALVLQYYADPSRLDPVQRAAVENLEKLMAQFLDMDFSRTLRRDLEQEDGTVLNVAQVLQRQIAAQNQSELGKATALNEFMAWSLSNQNLIDVMRKTKVRSPLRELVFRATGWLRKLLGLAPTQKLDMFSNILTNTAGLIQGDTRLIGPRAPLSVLSGAVMNQMSGTPVDARLADLMDRFETKIASHLRNLPESAAKKLDTEGQRIKEMSNQAVDLFKFHGFPMDDQQASAFRSIQQALASSMQLDKRALVQAQRVYSHVMKQLTPKHFEDYPDGNLKSQDRFNVLTGEYGWELDAEKRSNLLASFLALSQVDPAFRKVLDGIDMPKDRGLDKTSADAWLTSVANSALDSLATVTTGGGLKTKTTRETLDRLSLALAEIEKDDRLWIERKTQDLTNQADGWGARFLSKTGERLSAWADEATRKSLTEVDSRTRQLIRGSATALGALLNEERGAAYASGMVSWANQTKAPRVLKEGLYEAVGITDENRGVLGLVNKVKAGVSKMRQAYREEVPKIIAEQFSRELTQEESSAVHLVLGRTDSGALQGKYAPMALRRLLTDKRYLVNEITLREEELKNTVKAWATYQRKAKELARYMVKGEVANNDFYRNATAIVAMVERVEVSKVDPGSVELIDILATLYALEMIEDKDMDLVANLADTEPKGIDFIAGYLWSTRTDELAKIQTDAARMNHYKGYIPMDRREGISLVVRDDSEHNTLVAMGYTRMGDYKGAGVETGKRGYYFSTVAGNGTYTQGAMQTIQQSVSGVDPRTGRTVKGTTAGVISGKYLGIIQQRLRNHQYGPEEALLPVLDGKGQVVAYERHMAPKALAALEPNTHMGEMLGSWKGRQAEEELAQDYNRQLIDNLKVIWDRDKKTKGVQFIDISDVDAHKDRVYADSWEMVPNDLKAYIKEVFGEDGFPIRQDMINNAVGYRAPSITDAWTGISRFDKEHQEAFVKIATAIHGDAFKVLATAEKAIQAGVSVVKSTIVVRSVVIPLANLGSNFLQLMLHGVSIRDMVSGYPTKLLEITKYQKNEKRRIEVEAEIVAQRTNHDAVRRLQAELRSIQDSNKRMSIWPLIEAGEFSTISEGLTEADAALTQGKWAQYIQGLMDKVPAKAGTVGRYAAITRDTALFQGMARAMQYGDFLSKAVLYDHLLKQGKSHTEALNGVTEEFVNYNLLPGRTRSGLESMGLTWFLAFKIRSMKVALNHVRNHPFRALMLSVGNPLVPEIPGVSLGSPIEDNLASVAADGRLPYALGPGMAFNAPSLHPWVNLLF